MGIEVLAGASLVASIGSGILGASGARKKADAESASYQYKAQVARNNAIIAERNAAAAVDSGGVAGQTNDLKTKNLLGQQLVTQAANGLDVNSGSNLEVRQSAADLGRLDTMTILNNAAKQSAGFKAQGVNFESEAKLSNASAEYAQDAGDINVMSSLLGAAGSVSNKWAGYRSSGVF